MERPILIARGSLGGIHGVIKADTPAEGRLLVFLARLGMVLAFTDVNRDAFAGWDSVEAKEIVVEKTIQIVLEESINNTSKDCRLGIVFFDDVCHDILLLFWIRFSRINEYANSLKRKFDIF